MGRLAGRAIANDTQNLNEQGITIATQVCTDTGVHLQLTLLTQTGFKWAEAFPLSTPPGFRLLRRAQTMRTVWRAADLCEGSSDVA